MPRLLVLFLQLLTVQPRAVCVVQGSKPKRRETYTDRERERDRRGQTDRDRQMHTHAQTDHEKRRQTAFRGHWASHFAYDVGPEGSLSSRAPSSKNGLR